MWAIQCYIRTPRYSDKSEYKWIDIKPSGGEPYRYNTKEEAENMLRLCYDVDPTNYRVLQVAEMVFNGD